MAPPQRLLSSTFPIASSTPTLGIGKGFGATIPVTSAGAYFNSGAGAEANTSTSGTPLQIWTPGNSSADSFAVTESEVSSFLQPIRNTTSENFEGHQ